MKKNNKVNPLTHFNNVKADSYRRAHNQMSNFNKLLKRYQGEEGGSEVSPGPQSGQTPPSSPPPPSSSPSTSTSPSTSSGNTVKGPISDNDIMMAMIEKGVSPRDMKKIMKAKTKVAVNPNTVIDAAGRVVSSGIGALSNRGGGPGGGPQFKRGGSTRKMSKGGALKPVPAGKVGLSKLPTPVRNKMGYQKKGGSIKRR
jgi:hypothetical protein